MKVAIIGGGPAGLFFARLLKRRFRDYHIDIFEQNPAQATYGFGVTLAGSARERLREVDEQVHDRLADCMVFNATQCINLNGQSLVVRYAQSGGAIERLTLLKVLEALCEDVGLCVDHERRIEREEDLAGYDLVVGADGANSAVRAFGEASFKTKERLLGNRFAWYGVDKALKPNGLSFKMVGTGCFIAHYYAYTPGKSTFVAECDRQTWEQGGLADMSDAARKKMMEDIFARELEGEVLQENKSIWRQFNAVTVEQWHHNNLVLLGDALRVAHFSIGSGTRLAMDDAQALFDALCDNEHDLVGAMGAYEARRKPTRDLFTQATVKSFEWYDRVRDEMKTDIVDFMHNFLTRTGRVDDDRLQEYAPDFYRDYVAPRRMQANTQEVE